MYVNDRDQINYHRFLTALRTMRGYLLREVSTGVCCESGMNRFEKGNRVAEKLVRDRLTARLGVSCEKYEDYLQPKEYVKWEQRMRIVKAIQKRDLKTAKLELREYEEIKNLNRTNQQFVETMRFMILTLTGAPQEDLRACIKKAVKLTVPNIQKAFNGEHLLSDQEVNLILEQMCLETPKKVIKDEKTWRITEFEKLISYMDNSCWEKLQKAKVYPKVTYYICKQLLSKETTEAENRRGLELCHNAIELLRDTSRLYYFIELTESRRALAMRLMEYDIDATEKNKLEEMLEENNKWESVFKDLYAEYKVAPYMSDFCYLYYENECHDMVKVIETRRNMLGLSRVKLGEGICSEKTIVRFEREGVNPSIELVRCLFDKMGMCAEYRRARVVTTDVNALMLSIETIKNINNYDFEKGAECLHKLEEMLEMSIPHNRQEISRLNVVLKYRRDNIKGDELYRLSKDSLEQTLPLSVIDDKGEKYLTRSEVTCLFDLAFKMIGDVSEKCLQIIYNKYGKIESNTELNMAEVCVYEFMIGELESYLGEIGKYEESNQISKKIIRECLSYRRVGQIMDSLYNIAWNHYYKKNTLVTNLEEIEEMLNKSIYVSELIRKNYRVNFYRKKLEEWFYN